MNDSLREFLMFLLNGLVHLAALAGFAFALMMNLFYLPSEYKKGRKFSCFIFIAALLYAFSMFWRFFCQ